MGTLRMEQKNNKIIPLPSREAINLDYRGEGLLRGGTSTATSKAPLLTSPQSTGERDLKRSAFTLTELLVVIAIIAILASLITAAAVNAMNASKRTAITSEINQLGDAIERFKTNLGGAYPPNVFEEGFLTGNEVTLNRNNLTRFMTKARPMGNEFNSPSDPTFLARIVDLGIRPSEALVLWLSGFSGDTKRPFTGADLEVTSIDDNGSTVNNVITYESFDAPLYEFDTTRLRFSRESNGNRRFIEVYRADGTGPFQLQLYEYFPKGSEKPYIYFNTVDTPETVARTWQTNEFRYLDPKDSTQVVYPLKRDKPNAPDPPSSLQFVEYVNQGKCQILHAGLDDAWGNFELAQLTPQNQSAIPDLRFPRGPFTGDLADTLSNFAQGTLENEQE